MGTLPQYYENDLQLINVDKASLQNLLTEFREAVRSSVQLITAEVPPPTENDEFGAIYHGDLGIALMFLRLEQQAISLVEPGESSDALVSEFRAFANARINPHISAGSLRPGRLSPLGSPSLGACVIRLAVSSSQVMKDDSHVRHRVHARDIKILESAIETAMGQSQALGGDEPLYGRVGLLWAILNIRKASFDPESGAALAPVFEAVPGLLDLIIQTGRLGARDYVKNHGEQHALPLMWPWHDKYYTGAIHGVCGILTILLACDPDELGESLPITSDTISGLCKIVISNNGHLPSSFPPHGSSRRSPLVQICHGAPGLLLLLAYARKHPGLARFYWEPEWDNAIRLSSERVWEEGILSKGGGLCHGIAGNAWPLLALHDTFEYNKQLITESRQAYQDRTGITPPNEGLSGDYFLSRALTLLRCAEKTRPFNQERGSAARFRMPDTPFSLFEGLAGTTCAWSEACVAIQARLRKIELDGAQGFEAFESDEAFRNIYQLELGLPGLAVHGGL